MGIAHEAAHDAPHQIAHALIGKHGDLGVEERAVDILPLPGPLRMAQGREHGGRRIDASEQVAQGDADLGGLAIGLAGNAHEPAHALGHEIVAAALRIGAELSEARDRAINEARLLGGKTREVEAVFGKAAHLVVLDHHIRLKGEAAHQGRPLRLREIDGDGALVAVGAQEVCALARLVVAFGLHEGRAPNASVVALPRRLHLDDVGPQVGQNLRAPRPGQHPRQIEHLDPVQRMRARACDAAPINPNHALSSAADMSMNEGTATPVAARRRPRRAADRMWMPTGPAG